MLGLESKQARNMAVKLLNCLYFQHDWSLSHPIQTQVKTLNTSFYQNFKFDIVLVKNPSFFMQDHNLRFLQNFQDLILDEVGFWDFKYMNFSENGLYTVHQERIIVQFELKNLQIHEVIVDNILGGFPKLEEHLNRYKGLNVNCLYIMGGLERDNGKKLDGKWEREETNQLAVVDRAKVSQALGGGNFLIKDSQFYDLMKQAQKFGIKIVMDCLARVSSSRPHKKYRDKFVYKIDPTGKTQICYGTEGKTLNYEDTAMLNYRKQEVWDLMIQETLVLIEKYGIDGIHLDNCQTWPNIHSLNLQELYRKETDGQEAYTDQEILEGLVVNEFSDSGYWSTDSKEEEPNPFLVKYCQSIWKTHPQFLIIAEVWISHKEELREMNIIKSGPIPRVYFIPQYFASIFGKELTMQLINFSGGEVKKNSKQDIHVFKNWYERSIQNRPKGSVLIQSSTSHNWPYPALLYKKATWTAVDVFFMLPDIPMTFFGEHDGHSYRKKTLNIWQKETQEQDEDEVQNMGNVKLDQMQTLLSKSIPRYDSSYSLVDSQKVIQKNMLEDLDESDLFMTQRTLTPSKKRGMIKAMFQFR